MAIKTQVNALLNKKMDRQEFLKHVAVGFLAVSGVASAFRLINVQSKQSSSEAGYGSSAYGGSIEK